MNRPRQQHRDHVREQGRGRLSRRTFLGGAAATLALPWLEAMMPRGLGFTSPARAAADELPRRLLFYFVPNGIHMPAWTPASSGSAWELTPILEPLAPFKDKLNVVTGLANKPAIVPVAGDHARGTGSFLTCVTPKKSEGAEIFNGKSVDQVAADAIGHETLFPSLQLATSGGLNIGSCDSGYSCAYSRNISWAGPSTPLAQVVSPRVLFDRLFAGIDTNLTPEQLEARRKLRGSVLDHALDDAKALRARLGPTDQHKVDEYLEGIWELETLLEQQESAPLCTAPDRPPTTMPFPDRVRAMSELMTIALRCDMSRVISFMLSSGGSNQTYEFLGVSGAHHGISHHQDDPVNLEKIETINTWETTELAHLLGLLDSTEELGGTVLDRTLLYWSSEIEDGNAHRHTNLPVLLAGGAGGSVPTGRHLIYEGEEPMADLFISLLKAIDVDVETFGADGTGPLAGLLSDAD